MYNYEKELKHLITRDNACDLMKISMSVFKLSKRDSFTVEEVVDDVATIFGYADSFEVLSCLTYLVEKNVLEYVQNEKFAEYIFKY